MSHDVSTNTTTEQSFPKQIQLENICYAEAFTAIRANFVDDDIVKHIHKFHFHEIVKLDMTYLEEDMILRNFLKKIRSDLSVSEEIKSIVDINPNGSLWKKYYIYFHIVLILLLVGSFGYFLFEKIIPVLSSLTSVL